MKKIFTILLVFMLCVFLVLISCSHLIKQYRKNINNQTVSTTQTQILYILSDYQGKIALYNPTGGEPIEIYEVYTDSLPYDDYLLIKNGIQIKSEDDLQKVIEEYLS